ncbi:MAG: 2-phospho-L-lactate transferase CofD family protein [Candidatus Dojkabacteria bacterium]|nr:2-phospho-L-lactate transferase CofD family protein [Candidatus Dojkabacteria bacterium]MDQ7021912.1 2-phospho-L-lactate transferase CofD family protein [Candidatus Dojkabacteria bacterium]
MKNITVIGGGTGSFTVLTGLKGHSLGNLFLTALIDIANGELEAIEIMHKLFNIKGKVYPITLEKCHLVAEYENGEILKEEKNTDEPAFPHDGRLRIEKLYVEPKVSSHKNVHEVIDDSGLIVLGPGDLYTSTLVNLVINKIPSQIKKSKAKIVYVSNLVTKFGQTYKFKLSDHVNEIERYLDQKVDYILFNSKNLPKRTLEKYKLENAEAVVHDMGKDYRIIKKDLLATDEI